MVSPAGGTPQTPTRVLVVDDEPQIVRALVINLKARKYEVDAAPDGRTALELAASRHPDVVVLDLGLPDMDGVEVIRGIRGWTRSGGISPTPRCRTGRWPGSWPSGPPHSRARCTWPTAAGRRSGIRRSARTSAG